MKLREKRSKGKSRSFLNILKQVHPTVNIPFKFCWLFLHVKSEISRGLFSICSCLLAALPFEYVDEHEDFNYDLDTAQSQAKYDARLLSQQMLSDAELQRQGVSGGQDNALDADSSRAQGIAAGSDLEAASSAQENLEPHSRAASCFTNGHKYTHGQKVGWR